MKSYEAMRLMVGGFAVDMAKRLVLSSRMIHKWCEPTEDYSDSGSLNPLDRLDSMMDEAQRLGQSALEIYAPIRYLCQGHGVFLPLPNHTCSTSDISKQTIKTIKEFGEALTRAAESLEDDKLTVSERKDVLREMDEAIHEMLTLKGMFHDL